MEQVRLVWITATVFLFSCLGISRDHEGISASIRDPPLNVTTVTITVPPVAMTASKETALRPTVQSRRQSDLTVSVPSGFTEDAFTMEDTTTAGPGINSTEPDVIPTENDLTRTAGQVCDRFTFLQMRRNGKVKQELPQLGEMLYCLTERCPQEFESYGCYCGQEGSGYPTDVLDRCCFSHHCCMEQVRKLGCRPERSLRSEVVCLDHKPKCIGWSLCEQLLCSCDKAAAECMAVASFNESLRFLTRQACQEKKASCQSGIAERPSGDPGAGTRTSSSEESSEEANPLKSIVRRVKRSAHHPLRKARSTSQES